MSRQPDPAQSTRPWTPPAPYEGMALVDTSFPDDRWVVAQYDGDRSYIYIRRERDGRLWHHTLDSWDYAWERDYLRHA